MKKVRPKKHLGQHFLTEPSIARRIAEGLTGHRDTQNVLEVGPGTGVLTGPLLAAHGEHLKCIELDRESIAYLHTQFPDLGDRLIEGDFLHQELSTLFGGQPFAVIGNFPYNISSQILFRVLEHRDLVPECTGMFQREVARRIVSPPHNKAYGILSVLVQTYYDVEYLFTVDEGCFDPPPKVKSGVIRLRRNDRRELPVSYAQLKTVVKTAFNTRRKTLRNSLKGLTKADTQIPADTLALRAENLGPDDFIKIAEAIFS